jgi:hypothetical protein
VFQLIRAVALRLFPPGRGYYHQHDCIAPALTHHVASPQPLRPRPRDPHFWTDDGPLLRPYVLSADEWTRRRRVGRPQAVSLAS